ncbi:MAG: hypothetical protein QXK76_03670 [Candidatus Woesearchaeota archaeon]
MNDKPYYLGFLSFIFSLIALVPYPFLLINSENMRFLFFINSISNLAGYAAWFGLLTGTYAMYKIRKEKLNGLKYAVIGSSISAILILIGFVVLFMTSP